MTLRRNNPLVNKLRFIKLHSICSRKIQDYIKIHFRLFSCNVNRRKKGWIDWTQLYRIYLKYQESTCQFHEPQGIDKLFHMPFHYFIYTHSRLFVLFVQMSLKAVSCVDCESTVFTFIYIIQMLCLYMTCQILSTASMLAASFTPICAHVISSDIVIHCM